MPVRIYDIAKKLGIESKIVLAKAKELGISTARVPSSSLDKITAEFLEGHFTPVQPAAAPPSAPEPIRLVTAPPETPAPPPTPTEPLQAPTTPIAEMPVAPAVNFVPPPAPPVP